MSEGVNYYETPTWTARQECWRHRSRYYWTCGTALALAVLVYCITPSEYIAQKKIADEPVETDLLLGLNKTTAMIKKELNNDDEGLKNPEIYSLILSSRQFCEQLATISINDSTDYYHYLLKQSQDSWYDRFFRFFSSDSEYDYVIGCIQERIKYSVSLKNPIITIQTEDRQPRIAALIVDSTSSRLQQSIIHHKLYRKQQDVLAAKKNESDATADYQEAVRRYAQYVDAHGSSNDHQTQSQISTLQHNVKLLSEIYKEKSISRARAEALLQQQQPSFTTLVSASTPQEPASPLLIVNILLYTFLAFVFTSWYTLYKRSYGKEAKP